MTVLLQKVFGLDKSQYKINEKDLESNNNKIDVTKEFDNKFDYNYEDDQNDNNQKETIPKQENVPNSKLI